MKKPNTPDVFVVHSISTLGMALGTNKNTKVLANELNREGTNVGQQLVGLADGELVQPISHTELCNSLPKLY